MSSSSRRLILASVIVFMTIAAVFGIGTWVMHASESASAVAAPRAQSGTPTPTPFADLEAFINDAPFPRTYMFYHTAPNNQCVSVADKTTLLEQRAKYANVFETHMQFGANDPPPPVSGWSSYQPWRVPMATNCTSSDPKMVEWMESQSAALGRNRWGLAVPVQRSFTGQDVIATLDWIALQRGMPAHIRSDNGSEFIAKVVTTWIAQHHSSTIFITPGSPWENPYIESFNGKFRQECLDRYLFVNLQEAQRLAEHWRNEYNSFRPHSSLDYLTPREFAARHGLSGAMPSAHTVHFPVATLSL